MLHAPLRGLPLLPRKAALQDTLLQNLHASADVLTGLHLTGLAALEARRALRRARARGPAHRGAVAGSRTNE